MPDLVIRNARVATMGGVQAGKGEEPLGILEDSAVALEDGLISWVGPDKGAPQGPVLDAQGGLLTPGFVEPHTHLLFGGERADEHALRLAGESYLSIGKRGLGILSTVRATAAASDEALVQGARARLERLVRAGVTTVEVKTGYGLSVAGELRQLGLLAQAARGANCEVVPTLLALHAAPPGIERAEWVKTAELELLPQVARLGLARGCDAFCEQGAFTQAECAQVLRAAGRLGLTLHLHADQLTAGGGAELAASLGCASADHLERTSEAGRAALAQAGTVAVLLPLAAFFLREAQPAQAQPFLAAGATVALGGNLNPGSQRIESVSLLLAAGCLLSGLTPAQALWACTAGGARALRLPDRGRIAPGLRADLVLHATRDPAHLPYHAGVEHALVVLREGQVVYDARSRRGELGC